MRKADLRQYMGLVGSIRIDHVCYDDALKKLKRAMDSVGSAACPICIHIIGATRTGKTTVIEDFLDQHRTTRVAEGIRQTVVYAKVPDKGTVKGLLENLLEALGDPHWHRGSESNMTHRLGKLLRGVGCRMIILDEFQHLCDKGQVRSLHRTADWVKVLADNKEWAVVAAGLSQSSSVIESNSQLRERFDAPLRMDTFDWRNATSRLQFKAILAAFQGQMAPFELPCLSDDGMALRMFLATAGRIGMVAKILDCGVRNAIEEGSTKIDLHGLKEAFNEAVWYSDQFPIQGGPFGALLGLEQAMPVLDRVMAIANGDTYADKSGHVALSGPHLKSESRKGKKSSVHERRQREQVAAALGGAL